MALRRLFVFVVATGLSLTTLDSAWGSLEGTWSIFLETCPDPDVHRLNERLQGFLDGSNASHRLRLVRCDNPMALNQAVQSSFSSGVTHFVIVATSTTLDLSSRSVIPSGVTVDYLASNDFLRLHQWKGPNYLAQFLKSTLVRWMWKYVYFYIDPYYETSLHSNVHVTEEVPDPYVVEQLNFASKSPPLDFLSNLKKSSVRHVRSVVVAVNQSLTLDVVRTASAKGLLSSEHQWIIFFNGNLSDLFDALQLRANSLFYVVRHTSDIDDWDARLLEHLKFERESFSGEDQPTGEESQKPMRWTEDATGVEILKLFLNEAGSVSSLRAAHWNPVEGLVTASSSRYPDYRKRVLKVVTLESPPYVIVQKDASGAPLYSGYLVDVLAVVASLLNFTVEYVPAENIESGGSSNSTWNGVVETLVRKGADVGLSDLAISPDRLRLIDFAQVAVDSQFTAGLFRRPGSEGNDKFGVYLEPFDLHVWIASIVTVFVLVASLYLSARITEKLGGEEMAARWDNDQVDVSRTILLGFQAVAQQGSELNFGNPSTRVIFVVLWIFALICYASYSATLMSYLTISKVVLPFTSLATLAQNKDYKIGFLDDSSHLEMFRESSSPVYHSVWKRILSTRFTTVVGDYTEGLSRVYDEKFVLLSNDKTMRYVTRNTCDLVVSEPLTSSQFVTLGFQKDSPHQEAFSRALRFMNDAGILYRLRDKWWGTAVYCEQDDRVFVSLSLTNVATGFLLLVAGIFFGSLALAIEGVLRRCGCVRVKREVVGKKTILLKADRHSIRGRNARRLHF